MLNKMDHVKELLESDNIIPKVITLTHCIISDGKTNLKIKSGGVEYITNDIRYFGSDALQKLLLLLKFGSPRVAINQENISIYFSYNNRFKIHRSGIEAWRCQG